MPRRMGPWLWYLHIEAAEWHGLPCEQNILLWPNRAGALSGRRGNSYSFHTKSYRVSISNVDPVTKGAPATYPRDPNWSRDTSLAKDDILEPFISIEDTVAGERHAMLVIGDSSEYRLAVSDELGKKDNSRYLKCSSYSSQNACSREWNAQIEGFWQKAKPLFDRALAESVAERDTKRRQIDVLMEPMRVASGKPYAGTPFTPEELTWAQQIRDARSAKLAVLVQKEQQALAAAEQKAAAEKQLKAALEAEAGLRREAYAATPKGKTAGVTMAAKAFVAPADNSTAAVKIIQDSENSRFALDTDLLELPTGNDPIYVGPNDQAEIDSAVAKLKAEGVKTLYVVDLTRWQDWKGPVSAKISSAEITVSTSVRDNPEYPQLVQQLKVARQEEAIAKAEYDRMSATANSGGYGTGTAGAIAGIFSAVSDGSRYSNAQTKVLRLEEALRRTEPQIRTTTKARVGFADSKFQSTFSGRVVVAACDLTVSRCAERERVIESDITVDQPLVLVQGDPDYARRTAEDKAATVEIKKQRETYSQIGFSTSAMGKYVDGLPMFVPIGHLAAWHSYAFEDFDKRFNQRNAQKTAAKKALTTELVPVAASLEGVKFGDPTGAIRQASETVATEERRKNVQGLE